MIDRPDIEVPEAIDHLHLPEGTKVLEKEAIQKEDLQNLTSFEKTWDKLNVSSVRNSHPVRTYTPTIARNTADKSILKTHSREKKFTKEFNDVVIYALGGYGKLLANMTAIVYEKSFILIDCGKGREIPHNFEGPLTLDRLDTLPFKYPKYGKVLPLIDQGYVLKGVLLTHHHADHVMGFPDLLKALKQRNISKADFPIYCSEVTAAFGKSASIPNFPSVSKINLLQQNNFEIEHEIQKDVTFRSYRLTHSSLCSDAIYLNVKGKKILFLPDHTKDYAAPLGPDQILVDQRFNEVCKDNPDVLIIEGTSLRRKTNVDASEGICHAAIRNRLNKLHNDVDVQTIVISTFATNPNRFYSILRAGYDSGRTVALYGRGVIGGFNALKVLNLVPEKYIANTIIVAKDEDFAIINKNKKKYIIFVTGHMGQPNAGLSKLIPLKNGASVEPGAAFSLTSKDVVVLASTTIPVETAILTRNNLLNDLRFNRTKCYHADEYPELHASGHIGAADYYTYISRFHNFKQILINHGDLVQSTTIYSHLAHCKSYNLRKQVKILLDGQWENLSGNYPKKS